LSFILPDYIYLRQLYGVQCSQGMEAMDDICVGMLNLRRGDIGTIL